MKKKMWGLGIIAVLLMGIGIFMPKENVQAEQSKIVFVYGCTDEGSVNWANEITIEASMTVADVIDIMPEPGYMPTGATFLGYDAEYDMDELAVNIERMVIYAKYDKYPITLEKIYIGSDGQVKKEKETKYYTAGTSWNDILKAPGVSNEYTFTGWDTDTIIVTLDGDGLNIKDQIKKDSTINSCRQLYANNFSILARYKEVYIVECAVNYYDSYEEAGNINTVEPEQMDWYKYIVVNLQDYGDVDSLQKYIMQELEGEITDTLGYGEFSSLVTQHFGFFDNYIFKFYMGWVKLDKPLETFTPEDTTSDQTSSEEETTTKEDVTTTDGGEGSTENVVAESSKLDAARVDEVKSEIKSAIASQQTGTAETESAAPVTITVDMKKDDGTYATAISKDILQEAKGSNVVIAFDMGDYVWEIDGADITGDDLQDIDMEVALDTNNIPDDEIDKLGYEDHERYQISLTHHGDFGFKAKLKVKLDKHNSGKYGNLYYYNDEGQFEYINSGYIDADGNVELDFHHASEYVIMIGEDLSATSGQNGNNILPIVLGIVAVLVVAGGIAAFVIIKKKECGQS